MVRLPQNVIDALNRCKPFPLATCSKEGVPNVAYVGALKVLDDGTLLVANNFMKKTIANIEQNPVAAVVVWDPKSAESYQVKFAVEVVDSGEQFEEFKAGIKKKFPKFPVHSMLVLRPTEVYNSMHGDHAGERIV